MNFVYKTEGTCAKEISFDVIDRKIYNINFLGGCSGNLKMLSKVFDGEQADKIIEMCKGNLCGVRQTSCADQLACAITEVVESMKSSI